MGDGMISESEKSLYRDVAGMRAVVERVVERMHARFSSAPSEAAIAADVEILWSTILEAYRRGAGSVRTALHAGEGVDRAMLDQAFDQAITAIREGHR